MQLDDPHPWLELDFGALREWGGLLVAFGGDAAPAHRVLGSDDGAHWKLLLEAAAGREGAQLGATGEADARFVRLELGRRTP